MGRSVARFLVHFVRRTQWTFCLPPDPHAEAGCSPVPSNNSVFRAARSKMGIRIRGVLEWHEAQVLLNYQTLPDTIDDAFVAAANTVLHCPGQTGAFQLSCGQKW